MQAYKKMYPHLCGYSLSMIRITFFFLFFFTIPRLSAQETKVTIAVQNVPISEVFAQIESQTKYSFAFANSNFNVSRKVTISTQNTDLKIVLDQLLRDTDYTYTIRKNRIFLSPVKVESKDGKSAPKKTKEISLVAVKTEQIIEAETENSLILPPLVSEKKSVNVEFQYSAKDSLDINKTIAILNNLDDKKTVHSKTPLWAVKSNLLLDLTASVSLGTEIKVGERYSFDLSVSYNPWEFDVNKNMKHILVQPEIRYWLCEPFNGHFFGLHGLYAHYNLTGLPFSDYMKNSRLQGDLYGIGLSYGYQWSLSKRWAVEGNFGVGYVHASYDRYACKTCKDYIGSEKKNYFAPTKASLSVIYFIK